MLFDKTIIIDVPTQSTAKRQKANLILVKRKRTIKHSIIEQENQNYCTMNFLEKTVDYVFKRIKISTKYQIIVDSDLSEYKKSQF
ncbi:hypothetical protein [Spiroplasma poulsonii]|uniref:hypothetical protein n=1 Tax=Spiroplasma poulsonii TaxID=2138 RepID=UPI001F4D1F00|nr:hypothetical protein [Spiroplasma poulsonii]UNF61617.1 hypothetical protein MNU24_06815 [Spiroplasma poulsonii]